MSLLLALFGRRKRTQQCLLLGEERTRAGRYSTSANDPQADIGQTLAPTVFTPKAIARYNLAGISLGNFSLLKMFLGIQLVSFPNGRYPSR